MIVAFIAGMLRYVLAAVFVIISAMIAIQMINSLIGLE